MSPQQDDLSAKDLMLMFLDKQTYELRHRELQERMNGLENKFDAHVNWANETLAHDRQYVNAQFLDVRKIITDKLEAHRTKLEQTEEAILSKIDEQRREDWRDALVKIGWLVALTGPVISAVLVHFWH